MAEGEPTAPPPVTAGSLLRQARERQGVHLAVLAASLKVAPRKLELMESDRFDELPDASFARALALSMCRALKLEAEPVLALLPHAQGEGRLEQMTRGLNQPFRERAGGDGGERWRWLSLPLAGAALLVLGALVVYLLPASLWTPSEVTPELVPGPGAGAALPPGSSDTPAAADVAAAAPPPGAAASAELPGEPASSTVLDTVFLAPPAEPASAAAAATVGASAPAEGLLSLRASAPSWVEVRDGKNQIVFSRTLAAGETAAVDGAPPLRLTIGNAAATQVSFRGAPVALKAGRENVARLELK